MHDLKIFSLNLWLLVLLILSSEEQKLLMLRKWTQLSFSFMDYVLAIVLKIYFLSPGHKTSSCTSSLKFCTQDFYLGPSPSPLE